MTKPVRLSAEEESKDEYFRRVAEVAQDMIRDHGKDFATGALVLAARWVAEGRMARQEDRKDQRLS